MQTALLQNFVIGSHIHVWMCVLLTHVVKMQCVSQNSNGQNVVVHLEQNLTHCQKSDVLRSMCAVKSHATTLPGVLPPQLVSAVHALKAKLVIPTSQGVSQKEVAPMVIVIVLIKVFASVVGAKTFAMTHVGQILSAPLITDMLSVSVCKDLSQVLWTQELA